MFLALKFEDLAATMLSFAYRLTHFIDFLFIYTCTVCLTFQLRVFAAMPGKFEVALRYCSVSVLFCIVFGGYVLSVDRMIQDVPWLGWLGVSLD